MDEHLIAWGARLAAARLQGGTMPDPPCPITLAQGYGLADRAAPALGAMVGWKIGATSDNAMAFLGIAEPIRGRIFAERVWKDGDTALLAGARPAEAEPELAFVLAHDLVAGGDPAAAVGAVHAAAEIVRPSHGAPFRLGAGFIVADNAAGLGVLIGPQLPLTVLDSPERVRIAIRGPDGATAAGTADAVMGHPFHALAWLARHLGRVPAGSLVLAGAMARAIPIAGPPASEASGTLTLDAGVHGTARLTCHGL